MQLLLENSTWSDLEFLSAAGFPTRDGIPWQEQSQEAGPHVLGGQVWPGEHVCYVSVARQLQRLWLSHKSYQQGNRLANA